MWLWPKYSRAVSNRTELNGRLLCEWWIGVSVVSVCWVQHTKPCLIRMICNKAAWTSSSMWPWKKTDRYLVRIYPSLELLPETSMQLQVMTRILLQCLNKPLCWSLWLHLHCRSWWPIPILWLYLTFFFTRRAYISFKKVTRIRCVHFTLHLVKQVKNSIYDITNQFE